MKNTFENQANDISIQQDSSEEWKMTKVARMNKYSIIRNNFITLLIFNLIDLFGFSFACLFYQWFKAGYPQNDQTRLLQKPSYMWVNFLYIKYNKKIVFIHENYDEVFKEFCDTYQDIDFNDCIRGFQALKNVGIAAFSFVLFGLILHVLEVIRLIYILRGKRNRMCLKAFFLHPMILISLSLPILLYIFMIIYLAANQSNGQFSFGPSFYVASGMFVFYFIVLIYYKQQKKRLEVHETMDKLLIELNRSLDSQQKQNQPNQVVSSTQIREEQNSTVVEKCNDKLDHIQSEAVGKQKCESIFVL